MSKPKSRSDVDEKKTSPWRRSPAAIAGLIAFITGVVTLVFTLYPGLRPDPGNAVSASLDVIRMEPATFGDYQARLGKLAPRPLETDPKELRRRGFVVYLRVEVNGRKRHGIVLKQSWYDAGTHRRLYPAEESLTFRSETPSDRWVAPLWVVPAPVDGKFYERYELYDRDVILALTDTPERKGQLGE